MTVSVSLPLFLALAVLASVGLGYVCCVIADALSDPDWPFDREFPHPDAIRMNGGCDLRMEDCHIATDWWSEDDVTMTVHEIREL